MKRPGYIYLVVFLCFSMVSRLHAQTKGVEFKDFLNRFYLGVGAPEAKETLRFPTFSLEWVGPYTLLQNQLGLYLSYGESEFEDADGLMQNRYRSHFLLESGRYVRVRNSFLLHAALSTGIRIENTAYASQPRETLVHTKDWAFGYTLKLEQRLGFKYGWFVEQRITSAPGEIFWNGNSLSLGLTFRI